MKRIDKENYYLDIAQTVLERSTCLRRRNRNPLRNENLDLISERLA